MKKEMWIVVAVLFLAYSAALLYVGSTLKKCPPPPQPDVKWRDTTIYKDTTIYLPGKPIKIPSPCPDVTGDSIEVPCPPETVEVKVKVPFSYPETTWVEKEIQYVDRKPFLKGLFSEISVAGRYGDKLLSLGGKQFDVAVGAGFNVSKHVEVEVIPFHWASDAEVTRWFARVRYYP